MTQFLCRISMGFSWLFALIFSSSSLVSGFVPPSQSPGCLRKDATNIHGSKTALGMAKKMRNKQAELAKKLAMAKEQSLKQDGTQAQGEDRLSDREVKELNDRRRFEDMLEKQTASLNFVASNGYLSREQEEAEIDAYQRGVARLFEGDPAPTQPFEELVNIRSENALGETAKRIVPWHRNTKSDYLIIVCDPRVSSPELRETAQTLYAGLREDMLNRLIIVNADTPAENRRWLKKTNMDELTVYSDEKREWMRAYTALGETRWSMTMFVIADERIQKIAREMEAIVAVKVIQNAVEAMSARKL